MRTGRASDTSGERTTIISPRTPRRSGSASRAARPRQSTTISASASGQRQLDAEADGNAAALQSLGQRQRAPGADRDGPRRERTARGGNARRGRARARRCARHRPIRSARCGRRSARDPARRATGRRTRLPFRTVPGKRSAHQAIDGAPQVTTSGSVVARSHHGASMPPAIHEQRPRPARGRARRPRRPAPRSASSSAQARPATPAPMTMTEDLANR